jgi:hypothetical protein
VFSIRLDGNPEQRVPTPVLQTVNRVLDVSPLAVSRDGSRFYFPQAAEQPDSDVIHVRTGWFISR